MVNLNTLNKFPIRIYNTPGKKDLVYIRARHRELCVRFFDKYFGVKYPFEKLDLMAFPILRQVPWKIPGLITFRVIPLDHKHGSVGPAQRGGGCNLARVAHQWFGDLVTRQWWDHIWLNEAFATWMSSKLIEVEAGMESRSWMMCSTRGGSLNVDA